MNGDSNCSVRVYSCMIFFKEPNITSGTEGDRKMGVGKGINGCSKSPLKLYARISILDKFCSMLITALTIVCASKWMLRLQTGSTGTTGTPDPKTMRVGNLRSGHVTLF